MVSTAQCSECLLLVFLLSVVNGSFNRQSGYGTGRTLLKMACVEGYNSASPNRLVLNKQGTKVCKSRSFSSTEIVHALEFYDGQLLMGRNIQYDFFSGQVLDSDD